MKIFERLFVVAQGVISSAKLQFALGHTPLLITQLKELCTLKEMLESLLLVSQSQIEVSHSTQYSGERSSIPYPFYKRSRLCKRAESFLRFAKLCCEKTVCNQCERFPSK